MNEHKQGAPFTHVSPSGQARMVDVSSKGASQRTAVATAVVRMNPQVRTALLRENLPKGDALGVATIAGVMAAKRTSELIPMCHPLPLDWVGLEIKPSGDEELVITCTTKTTGRTGVEMEAMTGAATAALAIYDMAKSADKGIVIGAIRLERKTGGKSGDYDRSRTD